MPSTIISTADLRTARENDEGYCTWCDQLGIANVIPSARAEECPRCNSRSLYGIDEAVRAGYLRVSSGKGAKDDDQTALF